MLESIASAAKGEAVLADGEDVWSFPEGLTAPLTPDGVVTDTGWHVRPLRIGEAALGYAAWRRNDNAARASEDDDRLIEVLVDLGAAAIVRARLGMANSRMEALARTEELRNALLSSISHDFRTPLSAILASASSLKDLGPDLSPEVRDDLLVTIQEETERLNRFVANLLNMTRLESRALTVDHSAVDLAELSARVWTQFGKRVGTRHLDAEWPRAAPRVQADPVLLEQALANVVENAVRFSPDGSTVTLKSAREGDSVVLDVIDEGPGVAPADRSRIFEKFYRAPTGREIPGTGLGLSIAKGLLEASGGAIEALPRADDRPGLRMRLTLPAAA